MKIKLLNVYLEKATTISKGCQKTTHMISKHTRIEKKLGLK